MLRAFARRGTDNRFFLHSRIGLIIQLLLLRQPLDRRLVCPRCLLYGLDGVLHEIVGILLALFGLFQLILGPGVLDLSLLERLLRANLPRGASARVLGCRPLRHRKSIGELLLLILPRPDFLCDDVRLLLSQHALLFSLCERHRRRLDRRLRLLDGHLRLLQSPRRILDLCHCLARLGSQHNVLFLRRGVRGLGSLHLRLQLRRLFHHRLLCILELGHARLCKVFCLGGAQRCRRRFLGSLLRLFLFLDGLIGGFRSLLGGQSGSRHYRLGPLRELPGCIPREPRNHCRLDGPHRSLLSAQRRNSQFVVFLEWRPHGPILPLSARRPRMRVHAGRSLEPGSESVRALCVAEIVAVSRGKVWTRKLVEEELRD